tara:strand:+ start:405 stop:539 length:135 start_codon:yes stop_codon:yes gene_type:complete
VKLSKKETLEFEKLSKESLLKDAVDILEEKAVYVVEQSLSEQSS